MTDRLFYFRVKIDELLKHVRVLDKKEKGTISLEDMEISDEEWDYSRTFEDILDIYHEPMLKLQASGVSTISLTVLHVVSLLEALKEVSTDELERANPYFARGLKKACDKFKEYYSVSDGDSKELWNHYLATVLIRE